MQFSKKLILYDIRYNSRQFLKNTRLSYVLIDVHNIELIIKIDNFLELPICQILLCFRESLIQSSKNPTEWTLVLFQLYR
jgi:hypothetical protein